MSFLVDKLAKHAGDIVADKIKSALGGGDGDKKDKKHDDKDGGFLSIFKRDKEDDDDHKGGLFSFGKDKDKERKDKDEDKGNFFHRVFNRDDDDDDREKVPKKSGFAGLFSEQDQPGGAGPGDTAPAGGACDHMSEGDLDLMSDLMEVANETS